MSDKSNAVTDDEFVETDELLASIPVEAEAMDLAEKGRPLIGKAAIEALEPFALGFLEAAQTWPGILDTNSRAVARSLHGVLRHLPEEALGDFAQVKTILDKDAPLELSLIHI